MTFEQWTQPRNLLIPKLFCFNLDCFVSRNFGTPGAIILHNGHKNLVLPQLNITTEFKITKAQVTMPDRRVVTFLCDSWVYASEKDKGGRIFFANKVNQLSSISSRMKALIADAMNATGSEVLTPSRPCVAAVAGVYTCSDSPRLEEVEEGRAEGVARGWNRREEGMGKNLRLRCLQ